MSENRTGVIAAGALLGVAAILIGFQLIGSGSSSAKTPQHYFTIDDGQTYFADDARSLPPFDHGGKQAVRAHVYESGGKRFVGSLERFTDEGRRALQQVADAEKSGKPLDPNATAAIGKAQSTGVEVKRPGDKDWSARNSATGHTALEIHNPPGISGEPVELEP